MIKGTQKLRRAWKDPLCTLEFNNCFVALDNLDVHVASVCQRALTNC